MKYIHRPKIFPKNNIQSYITLSLIFPLPFLFFFLKEAFEGKDF